MATGLRNGPISPFAFGPAAWLHTPNSAETSTPNNSESDRLGPPCPFLSLITSFVMGYRRPSGEVGWGRAISVSSVFLRFLYHPLAHVIAACGGYQTLS